jgi:hypothetical protein
MNWEDFAESLMELQAKSPKPWPGGQKKPFVFFSGKAL